MKFCHLSAAVRANVRWKVEENRQACFPRTITANFMTVFADMFPADLWFAKAAFILLSLCWAATTISRREQCLFWQLPLSFLAPQIQQASPQKPLYKFMGMKRNFYVEKHRFNPKIAPWKALLQPQLLHLLWQTCSRDWSQFFPQGLAPAPWLCPHSPCGAELRLCWQPSSVGPLLAPPVVTLDHQTLLASLIFSVTQTHSLFCSAELFQRSTISSLWRAVISIMKNRAGSTARESHLQCFSYLRSHQNVGYAAPLFRGLR